MTIKEARELINIAKNDALAILGNEETDEVAQKEAKSILIKIAHTQHIMAEERIRNPTEKIILDIKTRADRVTVISTFASIKLLKLKKSK